METTAPRGAPVAAEGFGLKGPRGWVFQDVSFTAPAGSLIAIEGPSGSGRTCLLLALAGRMRSSAGHAEVAGLRLPGKLGAVRRLCALGPVDAVAELETALTVGEHLRERIWLQRRFEGPVRTWLRPRQVRAAEAQARIGRALAAAGLDPQALPKGPRTLVRDLERLEALRLGVALALLGEPRLLAVDDADHKLSGPDRAAAWSMLRGVAETGITVLAACTEAPQGAVVVRPGSRPAGPEPDGADGPPARRDAQDAQDARDARDGAPEQAPPAKDRHRPAGRRDAADAGAHRDTADAGAHRTAAPGAAAVTAFCPAVTASAAAQGSADTAASREEDRAAAACCPDETEPRKGAADAYAETRSA